MAAARSSQAGIEWPHDSLGRPLVQLPAGKITIKDKTGKELMSFPLTVGVIGAAVAPILAAVGAIAALIGECTISVEREEEASKN